MNKNLKILRQVKKILRGHTTVRQWHLEALGEGRSYADNADIARGTGVQENADIIGQRGVGGLNNADNVWLREAVTDPQPSLLADIICEQALKISIIPSSDIFDNRP